jgi:AmmeMemoRadiSam system protein B/AmmeMemoRadiSam system protein A
MKSNRIPTLYGLLVCMLVLASFLLLPRQAGTAAAADQKPANASIPLHEQIHESVIAGIWYPRSPEELRQQVGAFLSQVPEVDFPGRLTALISPHAGYAFSGQVAAYGYKLLEKQKFETVIIIGPSHHTPFSGVAVYDRGGFRTPLGVVPLDYELISALEKREPRIRFIREAHLREHSLEMQLPFLQVVMPRFKLVPLVMGEQDFATCKWLAQAIAEGIKGKSVLIVASSDLSHYRPYDEAKLLDQVVLDKVGGFDPKGLSESIAQGKCGACGSGAIITAMLIAQKQDANYAQILQYANSGDVTGDRSRVVGYMAAALGVGQAQSANPKPEPGQVGLDLGLSADEKGMLHRIAKETIEAGCRGATPSKIDVASPKLKEPNGAFVTLHKNGELRGCIGHITASLPLAETIAEMATAAAFHDPRFRPVRADELKDLKIEISVLTPLTKISSIEEIRVGTHGLYIRQDGRSGLLLPQVATEYGWDRAAFLEQACLKANLPRDAWKHKNTEIYIFSADIF